MHSVRNSAIKKFHQFSITASRQLIARLQICQHTNTLTNLKTSTWLRLKNVLHNIKILHQEVVQPLQQQPSLVKDKNEAPRVKRGNFPSIHPYSVPTCAYSCKRLKRMPACTGWEAGQVSNLSQGNGSTVSQYLTAVKNTGLLSAE